MTLNLELEIKSLLEEFKDPEVVAGKLVTLFSDPRFAWSEENLLELYRYLLNCGLYQNLIRFCLAQLPNPEFKMPWAYFIEAVNAGVPDLEEDVVKYILLGIQEDDAAHTVSLASGAERFVKNAKELKNEHRRARRRDTTRLKGELMDELLTLRTQQLYEQEKMLLGKLQRMFPGDADILEEVREHKERYALEILSRRSPLREAVLREAPPTAEANAQMQEFNSSFLQAAAKSPDLAFDFAIAAYMMDLPETTLVLLKSIQLSSAQKWFLLEIKLKCRLFLEILGDLNEIELALAHEPETFFATAYLRAQAYWGLQQKHMAIEILESILAARPNYRSSSALLEIWRAR